MADTYEYTSAWTERLKAAGMAYALLRLLSARGFEVSKEARERLNACRDIDQLGTWVDRCATMNHIDELFDE